VRVVNLAVPARMTRSLVVLDRVPYPAIGGQQLRYRQCIEALRALGPVTLLCLRSRHDDVPPVPADAPPVRRVNLRTPRTLAYRWARLLGPRGKDAVRARLREAWLEEVRVRVGAIIDATEPDLVVVEAPQLVAALPPLRQAGRRLVYDAHNVEKVLWGDLDALRQRLGNPPSQARFRQRIVDGEASLVATADQIWACSEDDALLFARVHGQLRGEVRIVPNTVDSEAFAGPAPDRPAALAAGPAPVILYTGSFGYAPNVEAGLALIREVLPRLRASLPGTRLVLCGRQPPEALTAAAARDGGVVVTGEVPDARLWFAHSDVVVVPLRHGGGTRLKILEALAAARPVVSTAKGAEGLEVEHGRHLLIADAPAAFAEGILWCLREPDAARAMAERGRALVDARYSWRANAARVREAVAALAGAPLASVARGLREPV
jgi:glycosyltransferase involved in cell wall biosynthesis